MSKPTFDELAARIGAAAVQHGGRLPADQAAAWSGYIGALLEWGLLDADDHARLQGSLPTSAAAAVLPIYASTATATAAVGPAAARTRVAG